MTKLLYFFPHDLMRNNSGCVRRAWGLLHYFKRAGFQVDLIYGADFWRGPETEEELAHLTRSGNFNKVYRLERKPNIKQLFSYLFDYKIHKIFNKKDKRVIPDFVTPYTRLQFNKILQENDYDYVIISYAYWANFIKHRRYQGSTKMIIDTHDFLTAQEQHEPEFDLGLAFSTEIERLNLFDEIWTVSSDEHYLFSQFCGEKVKLVPITFEINRSYDSREKQFDLIYVASDNPHNRKAANWFFENVFPKLDRGIKLCVIGGIVKVVPEDARITKIAFSDDLSLFYAQAKIAICPILSGTGVKVKILEALSFGLPVVCSPKGVDGLANKYNNGCMTALDATEFIANIYLLLRSSMDYKIKHQEAVKFLREYHEDHVLNLVLDKTFDLKTAYTS